MDDYTGQQAPSPATDGSGARQPSVEDLYRMLRVRILRGEMAPGSVISQVRLAAELHVNRTPLREALRMLQRDGLIEGEYNRRARVTMLTSADLEQVYALRIAQEVVAIRLTVPRFSDAELDRLDRLQEQMVEFSDLTHLEERERCHGEFHRLLVCHAGDRIVATVGELADYCERYRRALVHRQPTATFSIADHEHAEIVSACRARDAQAASTRLALHLARTALSLASISDPTHDPAAVREALYITVREVQPPRPFAE